MRGIRVDGFLSFICNIMKERVFRFKQFEVNHTFSAMKVGVDGVLIGSWAHVDNAGSILDVGSGCGLIALMCAQRNSQAAIYGVEIEHEAVKESQHNVSTSPWSDRVEIISGNAIDVNLSGIDLIISNPPYFDSGIATATTERELARHCGSLNPTSVIDIASRVCSSDGRVAMIYPVDSHIKIEEYAKICGWHLVRLCRVRGHDSAPVKRCLVEYSRSDYDVEETDLVLEKSPGQPTDEYRELCRDFYLKF